MSEQKDWNDQHTEYQWPGTPPGTQNTPHGPAQQPGGDPLRDVCDSVSRGVSKAMESVGPAVEKAMRQVGPVVDNAMKKMDSAFSEASARRAARPYRPQAAGTMSKGIQGGLMIFGGVFLTAISLSAAIPLAIVLNPFTLLVTVPLFLGSVSLITGGGLVFHYNQLYKQYLAVMGERKMCEVETLAQMLQKSRRTVIKELQKLAAKGYFKELYFSPDRSCVMLDRSVYETYMQAASRPARAPKKEQKEEAGTLDESRRFLAEMTDIRSRVENAEMAAKIKHLEETAGKIFRFVEEHPEREPEVGKFLRYYLPTTLKLLRVYDEMDAQDIEGETINSAMQNIHASLDTINAAFEKLLDGLFQRSAMDINAEISVMQSMLKQEGLAGEDGLTMNIPAPDEEEGTPQLRL
ncbi:MAG: 5-bromo-4-chloroindolyl phosphate hydrolysis family protein [Oscillospiraceae bacterium]|nr:5-bromo-4-chloroindolyl phosphate hydrolysis family protein [Oscillospiraceae bacterium]